MNKKELEMELLNLLNTTNLKNTKQIVRQYNTNKTTLTRAIELTKKLISDGRLSMKEVK